MKTNILPLGTIVTLQNGDDTKLMIVSRASLTETEEGEKVYFDYGAVVVPNGLQGNQLLFFNQEDVKQVIFRGYVDLHEQQFEEEYDELVSSSKYPKGRVVK